MIFEVNNKIFKEIIHREVQEGVLFTVGLVHYFETEDRYILYHNDGINKYRTIFLKEDIENFEPEFKEIYLHNSIPIMGYEE